ncbi:MAG TPA: hypothetical protein VJL83_02155 [Patescibacteria group bacterium]|nr:hypothetical protein [Patescibacteria group bacterium]
MLPSEYLHLLEDRVAELRQLNKGLSANEFNNLCRTNQFFRKDLLLELRDFRIIADSFQRELEKGKADKKLVSKPSFRA